MGYSTRPSMVASAAPFLRSLMKSLTEQDSVQVECTPGMNPSTEQYRIRRLLAACDTHREACGGEFAGIGAMLRISLDKKTGNIVISKKGASLNYAYRVKHKQDNTPSVADIIATLDSISSDMAGPIPIPDDLSIEHLEQMANRHGWKVFIDDGHAFFERVGEKKSYKDILSSYSQMPDSPKQPSPQDDIARLERLIAEQEE